MAPTRHFCVMTTITIGFSPTATAQQAGSATLLTNASTLALSLRLLFLQYFRNPSGDVETKGSGFFLDLAHPRPTLFGNTQSNQSINFCLAGLAQTINQAEPAVAALDSPLIIGTRVIFQVTFGARLVLRLGIDEPLNR